MADETKVRVKLDTGQAKSELAGLLKEGKRVAGKVSAGVRATVGRGLGAVGFGGAVAAGAAAFRGATESGLGDVASEALGGYGAQLAEFFLGDLDEKARASRSAREETIQAFGAITGARGGAIPPGARQYFENVKSLRLQEEKGREAFERDQQFRGPGIGEFVDRIMGGIAELVSKAVERLGEILNPFGGK